MTDGFIARDFSANNSGGVVTMNGVLKVDLIPVLNAEAAQRGLPPATERMWGDWIDEDLIENPEPKGRWRGENALWQCRAIGSQYRRG
jgi:hypothetical protein